jgi:hypothetical protein
MVPFAPLLSAVEAITDPRRAQGRRYPLPHLLLLSVLAVLAGATSYRGTVWCPSRCTANGSTPSSASGCAARPP